MFNEVNSNEKEFHQFCQNVFVHFICELYWAAPQSILIFLYRLRASEIILLT